MKNKKRKANPLQLYVQTRYRTLVTPNKKERAERGYRKYKKIDY